MVKAVEIVRNEKIDFLLAVGGGSVIDGTKFIALASCYEGDSCDLLKYGLPPIPFDVIGKAVPFGTVLILPATGSEMNNGAVISYEHGKYPVLSELAFPKFSILDPAITFTLPKIQVANGVIDAFVHVTESVAEPENYDARANHVWCATLALCGIVGAGVPQDWALI